MSASRVSVFAASPCIPLCDNIDIKLAMRDGHSLRNNNVTALLWKFQHCPASLIRLRAVQSELLMQPPVKDSVTKFSEEWPMVRHIESLAVGIFIWLEESIFINEEVSPVKLGCLWRLYWSHDLTGRMTWIFPYAGTLTSF
jgi:hypothetical protein